MEKIFYPATQRRLRADEHIRELTASVRLSHKAFIQPLFVDESLSAPREVNGLAGIEVDTILKMGSVNFYYFRCLQKKRRLILISVLQYPL